MSESGDGTDRESTVGSEHGAHEGPALVPLAVPFSAKRRRLLEDHDDVLNEGDEEVEGSNSGEQYFEEGADDVDEDDLFSEDEDDRPGPQPAANHDHHDHHDHHNHRAADAQTDVSSRNAMQMGLDQLPGFSKLMMGEGIKPVPAIFQTGLPGYWCPWNSSSSPFREGNEPRPARVLCIVVPLEFIAKDAARIGEWETLADEGARARQVTTAALLGMLTTGTAKGWTCTKEHSELIDAKNDGKEGENFDNVKKRLNGNVKTYTYRPHADDPVRADQPDKRGITAMQFGWFLEELYSPDASKVVAVRIMKLIYCASHQDDDLWANLIEETSDITRAGNINAIPEALRKPKLMVQNKLQRSQINDENLEETASTQWKRIDSMSALTKHLLHYAGATDSSRGRPLYADMAKDVAAGCADRPLRGDDKWGGRHPLGPSVALNFKRFLKRDHLQPGHPGVNVCIAGAVDASGNPIKILQAQCNPNNYFDRDGTFRPPDEVVELGAMWMCHDNSVKNIFNVPFPRPVHGSVVPDDVLLQAFFNLYKNDDKMLRRTQRGDNPKGFDEVRDVVEVAFNSYATERDAVAAQVSKGILNSEMLAYDSIDKTVAEQERLDRRAYEKKSVDKVGDVWVLEPRQALRDISLEQERVHSMIDEYDKHAAAEAAQQAGGRLRQAWAATVRARVFVQEVGGHDPAGLARHLPHGAAQVAQGGGGGGHPAVGRGRRRAQGGPRPRQRQAGHGQPGVYAQPVPGAQGPDAVGPLARLPDAHAERGGEDPGQRRAADARGVAARGAPGATQTVPQPCPNPTLLLTRVVSIACAVRAVRQLPFKPLFTHDAELEPL